MRHHERMQVLEELQLFGTGGEILMCLERCCAVLRDAVFAWLLPHQKHTLMCHWGGQIQRWLAINYMTKTVAVDLGSVYTHLCFEIKFWEVLRRRCCFLRVAPGSEQACGKQSNEARESQNIVQNLA